MPEFPQCVDSISELIDIPVSEWPLNCHAIATAILQMVPVEGMRLARGHWTGHVSRKSQYRNSGIQQHSWLVAKDGRIVDPTRWAMEDPDRPKIYIGEDDHYDEAGIEIGCRIPPAFPGSRPPGYETALAKSNPEKINRIAAAVGMQPLDNTDASAREMQFLADKLQYALSSPPDHLDDAEELYKALQDAGLKAIVRYDLWSLVMEPSRIRRNLPANRWFTLPEFTKPHPVALFYKLCTSFISVEERDIYLEDELEEIGYTLDEWHESLNNIEYCVGRVSEKPDAGFDDVPRTWLDPLVVVASFILGKGFGTDIRIERYARSFGYSRKELDAVMRAAGDRVGYDNAWI